MIRGGWFEPCGALADILFGSYRSRTAPARSPTRPPNQGTIVGGRVGEWAAAAHASASTKSVEDFGEARLDGVRDARSRSLAHQRLGMAVERGDDDLFDDVIDRGVGVDHLLEPRRQRTDDPVSAQHAEEGAAQ